MSLDDEHRALTSTWVQLRTAMDDLPGQLEWADTQYLDVTDMADRVRGLAQYLDSAVSLAQGRRYAPAFALLRSGLEHCLVDWLVFLGRTLVQRFAGVTDEQWEEWCAARADGAAWTTTIRDWTRTKKGDVRVVREGMFSEIDGRGHREQVSIYYFLLEQYRPTIGPPSAQGDDWALSSEDLRRIAQENDALWRVYLTWSSLLTNLRENHLIDDADAARLATHYRFLSGFAHPVIDYRHEVYGKSASVTWPTYDHYSSELTLLYAIVLGGLELRNFTQSLPQRRGTTLSNGPELARLLSAAEGTAAYFWFLGSNPSGYDSWKARNETAFRLRRVDADAELPPPLSADQVPYPTDPLRRLVAMHSSAQEFMTGLAFVSLWNRYDARWR